MFGELPIDEWEQVRAAFTGTPGVHATLESTVAPSRRQGASSSVSGDGSSADLQEQSAYQCASARFLFAEGDRGTHSQSQSRHSRRTPSSAWPRSRSRRLSS